MSDGNAIINANIYNERDNEAIETTTHLIVEGFRSQRHSEIRIISPAYWVRRERNAASGLKIPDPVISGTCWNKGFQPDFDDK